MDRVRVIELTLWGYHAAWWSLIPILGLVPAVVAFSLFWRIRDGADDGWNPAGTHLRWGLALATIGFASSALLLGVPLVKIIF